MAAAHREPALCVNEILGVIQNHLVQGYRIEIRGFGSFSERPPTPHWPQTLNRRGGGNSR